MKKIIKWFNDRRNRRLRLRLVEFGNAAFSDRPGATLLEVERVRRYVETGELDGDDQLIQRIAAMLRLYRTRYPDIIEKTLAFIHENTKAHLL